jgi:hypothetical protein
LHALIKSHLLLLLLQALQMPALSPTMEQGNIVSWQVKEGDEIAPGTVLAEIETDKATLAFENQDEGFIAKILAPAGSKDIKVSARNRCGVQGFLCVQWQFTVQYWTSWQGLHWTGAASSSRVQDHANSPALASSGSLPRL